MKITIIIPDLSEKTFKRTKSLYRILKKNHELQILAIYTKNGDDSIFKKEFASFEKIKCDLGNISKTLNKKVTGDIVYAIRSKPTSFGLALGLKDSKKIPVIVDICYSEMYQCFPYSKNLFKNIVFSIPLIKNTNSFIYTFIGEKRLNLATDITVSSLELQKKHTGTFIPSACDTEIFNPSIYKINEIREYMHWDDKKIFLFWGKLDKEHDINTLLEAMSNLNRNDLELVIIGDNKEDKKITQKYNFVTFLANQPDLNIAKLISACDFTIFPIKNIPFYENAIPDEIYPYLACNKKIITSKLFDEIASLKDEVFVYESENIADLKLKLDEALKNTKINEKSRDLVLEKYSDKVVTKKLEAIFNKCFADSK